VSIVSWRRPAGVLARISWTNIVVEDCDEHIAEERPQS
jgi:hypothetical protein